MNILLINHYAGSPLHGMEYRPYYLAREWMKLGHKVRIVASSESHLHQVSPILNSSTTVEKIDGVEYLWLKTPVYEGNGLERIINMFSFAKQLFSKRKIILKNFSPNIVIASSPHPFIFRGAKNLAKKSGARLIYEVRDLWPLSLIELLGLSPFHPLILLMQYEENYAYKYADKVASLLPKALDYMSDHGLSTEKFIYTPNGVVVGDWNDFFSLPSEQLEKISQFRSKFRFLIGYAGTHGKPNALSFLVDAAKLIENSNIGIVLMGSGKKKNSLISQVKLLKLKNILFLDPVSKKIVPAFLVKMDALYIGWERKPLYRFGISANKLFEYMMSGKPIIHSSDAGNDPVVESDCGISTQPENKSLIALALMEMSNLSDQERNMLGNNGKNYVANHFDYSIIAKKYLTEI